MKKRLLKAFMVVLVLFGLGVNLFTIPVAYATTDVPITRATEYMWYYRYNDEGIRQMRLWNLTYERWETDWINCSDIGN